MKNLLKVFLLLGLIALWIAPASAVESTGSTGTVTGPDTSDVPDGTPSTEHNFDFDADSNSSE